MVSRHGPVDTQLSSTRETSQDKPRSGQCQIWSRRRINLRFNWYTCWMSLGADGMPDNLIKEGLKQPESQGNHRTRCAWPGTIWSRVLPCESKVLTQLLDTQKDHDQMLFHLMAQCFQDVGNGPMSSPSDAPPMQTVQRCLEPFQLTKRQHDKRGACCLWGKKRLLREGNDVALLSNQKGNYESLKLIIIKLKCMCIWPGPPKRCTWILTCLVCPIQAPT